MRLVRPLLLASFALSAGCVMTTQYRGDKLSAKAEAPAIVDKEPTRAHRKAGRLTVLNDEGGETPETILAKLAQEGRKRGCDVLVCDISHRFTDGVAPGDDSTGLRYFQNRVDGAYADCEVFQ